MKMTTGDTDADDIGPVSVGGGKIECNCYIHRNNRSASGPQLKKILEANGTRRSSICPL